MHLTPGRTMQLTAIVAADAHKEERVFTTSERFGLLRRNTVDYILAQCDGSNEFHLDEGNKGRYVFGRGQVVRVRYTDLVDGATLDVPYEQFVEGGRKRSIVRAALQ